MFLFVVGCGEVSEQLTDPSCTYSISPTNRSHGHGSETGSVSVTTQSGCSWTAVSNVGWITITSGSSGTGSGTVYYSVSANTSTSSRTGTITIASQTFTVTQAGTQAGTPTSSWARTYGGTGWDEAYSIQQTSDGGYIVAGYTLSFGAGSYDLWVLKLNQDGTVAFNPNSGAVTRDTNATITDTTVLGQDTIATVANTSATVQDTNAIVTDTNATVRQQAP